METALATDDLAELRERVAFLEHERSFNKTALETMPGIIMRVSFEGIIEFVSRVLPEYRDPPLVGQSIYAFISPSQHEMARSALAWTVETRKPSSFEVQAQAPDGSSDWYILTAGAIVEHGRVTGLTLVAHNSSKAREIEDALVESRASLKLALDAGNVGVWQWDQRLDQVEWDEKLTKMFGVSPERAPRTLAEFIAFVPEAQRPALVEHVERALATGVYTDFEFEVEAPDGPRWFIIKGGGLRTPRGELKGLIGSMVDVTEHRRVVQHLEEVQKFEAVAQLSAGVAHNFNNMLAVIMPALELIRLNPAAADPSLLGDAFTAAVNAAQMVRQLMVFSHTEHHPSAFHEPLCDVVRREVELCRRTFERNVVLELREVEPARFASVESAPMGLAVMNLLYNARDALTPDLPPHIEVSARVVEEKQARARHRDARGNYVELRVTDTGCGMDAKTRRRMLEPFFTTKPPGRGIGLGLATAWATIKAHSGFLDCSSAPGRGTTVLVLLPAQPNEVPRPPMEVPASASRAAPRVVLLIEDEEVVAQASAALLTSAGFTVISAASGQEALRIASSTAIDCAILDYLMPGLTAEETLAGLRKTRPGLAVICLTGLQTRLEGATAHLIKPVSRVELLKAVEAALAVA